MRFLRLSSIALVMALPVGLLLLGLDEPRAWSGTPANVVNSLGMKFVLVPAGKFQMGSPETEKSRGSDELQHEVAISKPFYLGIHEVTQEQYSRVMGKNPSWFQASGGGKQRVEGKPTKDYPVDTVSWHDAMDFCKKLSAAAEEKGRKYRLPTEAEWEYACRAGTTTVFYFGNDLDSSKANFNGLIYASYGEPKAGPFLRSTTAVGSFRPNAWGLYDMHGNVQEWVQDFYADNYYAKSPPTDPPGPAEGELRVLRGGGWPNSGGALRSAVRNKLPPETAQYSGGFRVVLEAK